MTDVVIVGGGLIGLATAWRAAEQGLQVTLVDDAPGSGASHVAAGMLAPVTEVAYGEEDLLRLAIVAARRWPAFVDDLEAASGVPVGHAADGTLLVGASADDLEALRALHGFQQELGLDVRVLRSRECRRHEPLLSPRIAGGLLAGEDHHVDPREVLRALQVAARTAGVTLHADRVTAIEHAGRRVTGVTLADGGPLAATRIVLAAGSASGGIARGLPGVAVPVRPVKGQLVVLGGRPGVDVPRSTVRGLVAGRSVYLVPRRDGRVVVGATQEEQGSDTTVTAGGVRQLLDDAVAILPGIDELALVETLAGSRPGTPDNRPLIGPCGLDGLLLATGHHRNGVLQTPITAEGIAAMLVDERPDPVLQVADPRRFATAPDRSIRSSA